MSRDGPWEKGGQVLCYCGSARKGFELGTPVGKAARAGNCHL